MFFLISEKTSEKLWYYFVMPSASLGKVGYATRSNNNIKTVVAKECVMV